MKIKTAIIALVIVVLFIVYYFGFFSFMGIKGGKCTWNPGTGGIPSQKGMYKNGKCQLV